jgi:hypothetical protein
MAALQDPISPRSFADYAKDFVIMIAVSALIVAGLVFFKQVLPPL